MQDADAILADVMDLVEEHGLGLDEVRAVIEKELLGEQPLPLRAPAPMTTEVARTGRRTERDARSVPLCCSATGQVSCTREITT